MKDPQLSQIWQSFSKSNSIEFNSPKLLNEMNNRLKSAERRVNKRDRREFIGSIVALFAFLYWVIKYSSPLIWLAFAISILVILFINIRLKKAKKKIPDNYLSLSILEQLTIEKKFVKKQQTLLSTAIYWYALPLFLTQVFFVVSIAIAKSSELESNFSLLIDKVGTLSIIILALFIFFAYIGWTNKKAAKVNWEPIAREIERLEREFKN